MDAGLSFQPGNSNTGGTPSSALAPLQSAVQVLSLNLPTAAAKVSPLASTGPAARGFDPETLVAQTLLKSLTGSGVPNDVLMNHLTAVLNSIGQTAPNAPPAPSVSFGSTGRPTAGATPPPAQAPMTMGGSGDAPMGGAAAGGRVA